MNIVKFPKLCLAVLGLCALVSVGCQNEKQSHDGKVAYYPEMTGETSRPASSKPEPQPQPQPHRAAAPTGNAVYYPTGYRDTSVLSVERIAPSQVTLGVPFEYKLLVTNLTKLSLGEVVISDVCGAHLKVESSSPQAQSLPNGVYRWNLGTMAPGETRTIVVRGSATSLEPIQNCVTASWDQRACSTITVVQPALKLALTAPAEVLKCDPIPVQYVVTNTGTGVATNVVLEQALPKGLTSSSGASSISAKLGDLGPGQSKTLNETLKASATGRYDHAAAAAGDGNLKANAAAATTVRAPALALTASEGGTLFAGRTQRIDLTLTNKGDGDARDTVLTYTVPAGVKVVSISEGATAVGNQHVWKLGTLKPGAVAKGSLVIQPSGIGTYNSSVNASAYCADAQVATPVTVVKGIPAILLEVVDATDPIEVGGNVEYIITVTNQGSANDSDIKIVAVLEDTQQFVSAGGVTAGKAEGRNVTFAPLATLAPKAQAQWKVTVKAAGAGDVRFKVIMNSDNLGRPVEETEATNFYK